MRAALCCLILLAGGHQTSDFGAGSPVVRVNLAGDLTVNDFDMTAPAGRLKPGVADDAGQKLAAFVYDGFGRLIRTQRWDPQGNSEVESYYYDGVRRIQERVDDDPNDPNSAIATREYVWGPGYVDEIVCQVDEQGDPLYYLQDANYNVVAVTNDSGDVVFQYAYEPYGGVIAADTFTAAYPDPNYPSTNRIGHQGLFFERLYVDADDPNDPNDTYDTLSDPALSPPVDPNLATPLPGLYQVRNRVLIPNLGRFAQRDMNETALPTLALYYNASEAAPAVVRHVPGPVGPDAVNLYAAYQLNPIVRRDPEGLFSLIDIEITQMFRDELTDFDLERAASFMNALRGFMDLVSERNLSIESFSEAAADGDIDAALEADRFATHLRVTMIAAGIFTAGMEMAMTSGSRIARAGKSIIRPGNWVKCSSKRAARRAAFRKAGIGRHGGSTTESWGREQWKANKSMDKRYVVVDHTRGHRFSNGEYEPGHYEVIRLKADGTRDGTFPKVKYGWE